MFLVANSIFGTGTKYDDNDDNNDYVCNDDGDNDNDDEDNDINDHADDDNNNKDDNDAMMTMMIMICRPQRPQGHWKTNYSQLEVFNLVQILKVSYDDRWHLVVKLK